MQYYLAHSSTLPGVNSQAASSRQFPAAPGVPAASRYSRPLIVSANPRTAGRRARHGSAALAVCRQPPTRCRDTFCSQEVRSASGSRGAGQGGRLWQLRRPPVALRLHISARWGQHLRTYAMRASLQVSPEFVRNPLEQRPPPNPALHGVLLLRKPCRSVPEAVANRPPEVLPPHPSQPRTASGLAALLNGPRC